MTVATYTARELMSRVALIFLMGATANLASAANALVISAPATGTTVAPGTAVTVEVTINTGTYPLLAIFGNDPLGFAYAARPTKSPVAFSLAVPENTAPGTYQVTAAGTNESGNLIESVPTSLDVEQNGTALGLSASPSPLTLTTIDQPLHLTVMGTFSRGLQVNLSNSTKLTLRSEDSRIVSVKGSGITALANGRTVIHVSYGLVTTSVPVFVASEPEI